MDTQNYNDEKLSDEDEQIFNNQFKNLDFKEQIEKNETEMKQKFNKLSKYQETQSSSTPVIDIENAILLVDEMTDLLQINCDMAKSYFYETHEDFNNNFGNQKKELVTIEYDQFKKILITALEEQQKYEKNNNNNNPDQNSQNSLQLSQNKIQNDNQNDTQDQFQNNQQNTQDRFLRQEQSSKPQAQVHYYDDPNTNIYTKHNNMIFGNFIHNFNKDIYQYFSDFSKESPNGEPQVKAQDIPLIMRVAFYIDNITFHKTKEDKEEFFNQQDSYKIVLSQIDRYLQSQQKIDVDSLDITQYKFQFNQFLDFLEYFLQNESDIFLKKNDESNNEYEQQNEYNENSSLMGGNNKNQSELEKQIKVNIQNYEEMLQNCNSEQERLVINNMLDSLYEQLNKLQIVKQPVEQSLIKKQKQLTKEEIRKKNMNEIFLFYCRQQYTQAPKYSFDRILYECHTMNLSNFLLFAKQFKINNYCLKLTKKMLPQIFKKVSNNYKDLTFQEFQIILEKIALLMFEDKDEELPNEFDKIEAFYKYIGVDDANFYRKHMHILNPPFNIQDPIGFRHLPKDRDRNIEIKKIPGKLAAELEKRKKERQMLVKKFISMTPKQSLQEQQYSSKLPTYEQNQSRFKQNSISQDSSYKMNIQQKKGNYSEKNQLKQQNKLNIQNKVSWQQLGQIDYKDMKSDQNKQNIFKPTDLFQDKPDQDDNFYLQQYDLQEEKQKKQQQTYLHRQEQEQYGKIKNTLRPSQKYLIRQDNSYNSQLYGQEYQQNNLYNNSQQNQNNQLNKQQNIYYSNPNLRKHPQNISHDYFQRAHQLNDQQKQKQNNQIQYIINQNEKQIQRGMQALQR